MIYVCPIQNSHLASPPSSFLVSSYEELCSDPSAHLSRLRCAGSRCPLWCGDWCPQTLEHQREYSTNTLPHTIDYFSGEKRWSAKDHSWMWYNMRCNEICLQEIVLLGDFNSGCSYVTGSEWQQIRLFTDKSFHWLIPDEADTTVSHTNCPYDRYTHSRLLTHTHRRTDF